jgi:hypothetical protein
VPEQHDLHPADRGDGGRVHDDRERVLEMVAEQAGWKRQERDEQQVDQVEPDETGVERRQA